MAKAPELLATSPVIEKADVLASKLPKKTPGFLSKLFG